MAKTSASAKNVWRRRGEKTAAGRRLSKALRPIARRGKLRARIDEECEAIALSLHRKTGKVPRVKALQNKTFLIYASAVYGRACVIAISPRCCTLTMYDDVEKVRQGGQDAPFPWKARVVEKTRMHVELKLWREPGAFAEAVKRVLDIQDFTRVFGVGRAISQLMHAARADQALRVFENRLALRNVLLNLRTRDSALFGDDDAGKLVLHRRAASQFESIVFV